MEELGVSKRKDGVSPEKPGISTNHTWPWLDSQEENPEQLGTIAALDYAQWDEDKNRLLCGNRWISAQELMLKECENRWQEHNEHNLLKNK